MKKAYMIVLFLLPCWGGICLCAAEDTVYLRSPNALGFYVGKIAGTGLHYQRWFGKVGLQTSLGVLYSPNEDVYGLSYFPWYYEEYQWVEEGTGKAYYSYYRNSLQYSLGIEVMYQIYSDDFAKWLSGNLYLFGGINHSGENRYYFAPKKEYFTTETGTTDYYWTEDRTNKVELGFVPSLSIGGGIGIEPVLFRHFSIPLEMGYYLRWKNFAFSKENFEANLMFQGGLRYRF